MIANEFSRIPSKLVAVALLSLVWVGAAGCNRPAGKSTGGSIAGGSNRAVSVQGIPSNAKPPQPCAEPKRPEAESEADGGASESIAAGNSREVAESSPPPLPAPPYITLGLQTKPGEIILCEGQPVPVYFELAADTPQTCWVALVLAQTRSKLACDNRKLAIQQQPLPGERMGQVMFIMPKPGEYRLRLFTSSDDHSEFVCEAQPFRVVSKEEWTELGKQGKSGSSG